jgi:predicted metal-dependent enzyme (double-stranded beta helix superfamily)
MAIPQSITPRSSFQTTSSEDFLHHSEPKSLDISIPHIYSRPFFQNDVWQLKNTAAARNYEVALDRRSYIVHFNNQQRIAKVIIGCQEKFYMEHPVATPAGFRKFLEASIEKVLIEAEFDTSPYVCKITDPSDHGFIHGYAKYLLYGDDNDGAPFCLQYFHFAPGQKTPLHDHPVACVSFVVKGQIVERHYQALSATEARKTRITNRDFFDRKSILDLSQPNIHSLKNKQTRHAGSVHFYYMDGDVTSRAVKTIYQKAPQNGFPILRNLQ